MKKWICVLCVAFTLAACTKENLASVTVQTANGSVTYRVEIANTTEKMMKGLMYRTRLDTDAGMLFLFDDTHPQPIAMWMKNTYISLDMLFIGYEGEIIGIAQNTEPLSLKIISPTKKNVAAVLEINAGEVQKHHIQKGDKLIYKP